MRRRFLLCFAGSVLFFGGCESPGLHSPDARPLDAGPDGAPIDASRDAGLDADASDTGPTPPEWIRFERIALEEEPAQLTGFRFVPDTDDELVAITRDGRFLHYRLGADGGALLGEVQVPNVHVELDCGLLSILFAPDFTTSGHVYVGQCFSGTESGIVRLTFTPPEYEDVAESALEILRLGDPASPQPWHNVGSMGFDPEGNLWALFGDKVVSSHAADPGDPLGGVVRIRVAEDGSITGAPGNPYETDERFHPYVYAHGLRSPWRGAMDAAGRLWVGDVGDGRFEEVSLVDAPGLDLGWPAAEGFCGADACRDARDPVVAWHRGANHPYPREDPLSDASGYWRVGYAGLVYAPPENRDPYAGWLTGATLFGEACMGFVRALEVDDEGDIVRDQAMGHLFGASDWDVRSDGYIYATSFGRCTTNRDAQYPSGGLWRGVPAEKPARPPAPVGFPDRLSEYGIYPEAPNLWNTPSEAQFYEPEYPLWTNGAGKIRHVIFPDARTPERTEDGYLFPIGTLFFKTFVYDGAPVETRVIRVDESRPQYAAYRWNDRGTEASLLDISEEATPVEVTLGDETFTHEIPSRDECRGCHEAGDRRVLGYTPLQLGETPIDAPDEETLALIGWAQGNCAHCHDGSGRQGASFSMLPQVFLENTIDRPTAGSASASGIRVVPGSPNESALVRAMSRTDDEFAAMPPIGVQRRDDAALAALRDWIAALAPTSPGPPD